MEKWPKLGMPTAFPIKNGFLIRGKRCPRAPFDGRLSAEYPRFWLLDFRRYAFWPPPIPENGHTPAVRTLPPPTATHGNFLTTDDDANTHTRQQAAASLILDAAAMISLNNFIARLSSNTHTIHLFLSAF